MIHEVLPVGPMGANCYLVACDVTKEAAVIDPGGDAEEILSLAQRLGVRIKYIINTHGHIDHIAANDEVKQATGAQVIIHALDADMLTNPQANLSSFVGGVHSFLPPDQLVEEGDTISIGQLELEVLHTPGHTMGGICLKYQDHLWCGDTLFAGSIGRSDFPGGNHQTLIKSIKTKLIPLGETVRVYPGHGPTSTIGEEKRSNPFL